MTKRTVRCLAENKIATIAKWGEKGFCVNRIDKDTEYGREYVLIQFIKEEK